MTDEQSPRVILVVEDQPANMLLARATLERAGFRVIEATDANDARLRLERIVPDLILMDIGLPGQDGLSLTREFKSDRDLAGIPIVALTAHATLADQERASAAGCDGYLSKPFSPRELVDVVTGQIERVNDRHATSEPPNNRR